MPVDFRTVTIEVAINAVQAYNSGSYRGVKNLDLDRCARHVFDAGLAPTRQSTRYS
jgi:hypothetical protein